MVESQQVLEWIAEGEVKGRAEGRAEALLQVLELRFPPGAPADLEARIRAMTDAEQLRRWLATAATVPSLEAFQQAMLP